MTCYIIGWKLLGRKFMTYSFIASAGFSLSYKIYESFDALFPQLIDMPFLAALLGAMFVGISTGLCVRVGGALGGDDALAMSISKISRLDIQWVYLLCNLVVLVLSLSYIPIYRIAYSFLTVMLSGQIIGFIQKMKFKY